MVGFSTLLIAASLCTFVGVGHTSEVNVGGQLGTWTIGLEYTPVQLTLGDTLVCSIPRLPKQGLSFLKRACLKPEDLDRVQSSGCETFAVTKCFATESVELQCHSIREQLCHLVSTPACS